MCSRQSAETAGYTPCVSTPGPRPGDTPLSAPLSGGKRPIARMPRLWSTQKCSASAGSSTWLGLGLGFGFGFGFGFGVGLTLTLTLTLTLSLTLNPNQIGREAARALGAVGRGATTAREQQQLRRRHALLREQPRDERGADAARAAWLGSGLGLGCGLGCGLGLGLG